MSMTPFIKHCVLLLLILALTTSIAPAQTITSISPASVAAGSGFFAITVNGSNFSTDAIVEVNGNPHYTIDHSTSTLMAYVYAPDVANPGTLSVSVLNDSGTTTHLSNKMSLTVTGSGTKPPPNPPPPPPPGPPPPPPPPQPGRVSITITSPVQNQQVCAPVTLIASAATSNAGAHVTSWQVHDQTGATLFATNGPVSSIDPKLSLPPGTHTLQIYAWDSTGAHAYTNVAFNVTMATPPCGGNMTGPVTKWVGCIHTDAGHKRQAVDFTLSQGGALPFDATLYFGANCQPNNWADRFGFGTTIGFGGFSYIFWFRDFPDQLNTSAIWTVGKQSSGCINYGGAVPAC